MPKLEYFVVAESVSVDQTRNTMSVFHILEEIQAPGFPIVIPMLAAVVHWNAEAGDVDRDFQVGIIITFPDGQHKEFNQNFQMIRPRLRTIANFIAIEIPGPGTMTVEIKLNGDHKASHTIDIRKVEA
jgi:hypothetical protein